MGDLLASRRRDVAAQRGAAGLPDALITLQRAAGAEHAEAVDRGNRYMSRRPLDTAAERGDDLLGLLARLAMPLNARRIERHEQREGSRTSPAAVSTLLRGLAEPMWPAGGAQLLPRVVTDAVPLLDQLVEDPDLWPSRLPIPRPLERWSPGDRALWEQLLEELNRGPQPVDRGRRG